MAARARRGHGEAVGRRHRRRRRLWPRRLHDPDGAGLPALAVVGSDYHRESIDVARTRAADAGVADRVRFEVADASTYTGRDYDLVTMFDALHDMGDPVEAARHVHDTLTADGTWMVVEPQAGDRVEDNFNPVGRVFYGFSTLVCTPSSLSQPLGLALGTQAGPARIREVTATGGFTRFARLRRPRSTWSSRSDPESPPPRPDGPGRPRPPGGLANRAGAVAHHGGPSAAGRGHVLGHRLRAAGQPAR